VANTGRKRSSTVCSGSRNYNIPHVRSFP